MTRHCATAGVLIIKFGALGDLIVATPAIRQILRAHAPDRQVWLLTSTPYADLFQGWDGLQVQVCARHGMAAAWRTLRWIRKGRFARIYDLQSNDRSAVLCALSGAGACVGNHPRFPYRYHPADRYRGQCHVRDRLDQVLVSAGLPATEGLPELPVTGASRKRVEQWLKANGLADRRLVILHAGANRNHPHKQWPYYLDLARDLQGRGLEILWTGGPDDIEINNNLAASLGHDITGQFSIPEEVALGRHARFAVTNDSAPMHILSCTGIPVFGIFGPTDWRRMHAIGQQHRVIALDKTAGNRDHVFTPQDISKIPLSMVMEKLQADGMLDGL